MVRGFWLALGAIVGLACAHTGSAAAPPKLLSPGNGEVRALVIGVNKYDKLRTLLGAVADADDIAGSLAGAGVKDMVKLTEGQATRRRVVEEMDRLVARSRKDDLVIITLAGHGARVPEYSFWKGSSDGYNEQFMLPGFDHTDAGFQEVVVNKEIKAWLTRLDAKGVHVILVSDFCHAGGAVRGFENPYEPPSFRYVSERDAAAAPGKSTFRPISMSPQEARSEVSALPHVTFFGAVDETKAVQEFKIGNERTKRGALSYAFARMIAGADKPADGLVTRDHAYDYVFKTVSTLSNDRQTPVREPSPTTGDLSAYKSVVFRLVGEADAKPDPTPAPRGIRVAAADGDANAFASIGKPVSAYAVVSDPAEADLVWDRAGQRLLAGSDEILSGATANDIPGAIDRMAAVASLKKLAEQRSFSITLQDGGKKYSARDYRDRKYGPIPVATGVAGRELLVFNIAGDGKLQMLFPSAAARAAGRVNADPWQMSPSVTKPFGADLVVALSSAKRQDGLEPWLRANHDKAVAGLIGEKLAAAMAADPDLRIGIVGLYTGP